nr:FxsA family protein [Thermoleophilaceae bacterium]
MRWLLVLVAFVIVPLAELWAILSVGDAIGVLPTILILLADSVLGALLLRSQGRGAWRRFVEALQLARVPSREIADGLLILVGAALLLTPGFLTDAVGVLLLVPPSRALVRRGLERAIARRMVTG